jgi:hypothetical protein
MALTFLVTRNMALTSRFIDRPDMPPRLRQHMLMAQITESFDDFLARVVRRLVPRLIVIDGELGGQPAEDDLLAELRMAVRLRNAVDEHIRFMVVARSTGSEAERLLDDTLGALPARLTWKELGEALGVSAQAAHRKYGAAAREREASRRTP